MTTPLRIAIVTYAWPPVNAIATHRPYCWAKYWSALGAEITVLTAEKKPYDGPFGLQLPSLPQVTLLEIAYGKNINETFFLLKKNWIWKIAKWLKNTLEKSSGLSYDPRRSWLSAASFTAIELGANVDVVVSTFGPEVSHLIAAEMKKANPSLCWIADYRDLWSQDHIRGLTAIQSKKAEMLEMETVGQYADVITTVSNGHARSLAALLKKEVVVITNGFDLSIDQVNANFSNCKNKYSRPFRIVYTGVIYHGHRDPTPLLSVISHLCQQGLLTPADISVEFYGPRNKFAIELSEIPEYSPFVIFMGLVSHNVAVSAQRSADLLLLLESNQPEARGVLTGKIFEYISSGVPVLSLGSSEDSEISELLKKTSTGVCAGDHFLKIKDILLEMLNDVVPKWFSPKVKEVMNYSRQSQAELMYSKLILNNSFGPRKSFGTPDRGE